MFPVDALSPEVLTAIHLAPRWLWPALVELAAAEQWTIADTRKAVAALEDTPEPPPWADAAALARYVVSVDADASQALARAFADCARDIERLSETPHRTIVEFESALATCKPALPVDVREAAEPILRRLEEESRARRAARLATEHKRAAAMREQLSLRIEALRW